MQSIKDIMEEKKKKLEEGRGKKSIFRSIVDKISVIGKYLCMI
jgi:hypothetical protein